MKAFVRLYHQIEEARSEQEAEQAMAIYFQSEASDEDKMWAISLLLDRRPKRIFTIAALKNRVMDYTGFDEWLFDSSYKITKDLTETLSLILPQEIAEENDIKLSSVMAMLQSMGKSSEKEQIAMLHLFWKQLWAPARLILHKLLTGGFRSRISPASISRALAPMLNRDTNDITVLLMSAWKAETHSFEALFRNNDTTSSLSKPYPFGNSIDLETKPESLGEASKWYAEYHWDGFRVQLIRRSNQFFIWTEGDELVTENFPDFTELTELDGGDLVIDGMVVAVDDKKILPATELQRKLLSRSPGQGANLVLLAFDLLEYQGQDIRNNPLIHRKKLLETLVQSTSGSVLNLSESFELKDWKKAHLLNNQSRIEGASGIVLKDKHAPYQNLAGQAWQFWKAKPFTIKGVLLYVQRGQGFDAGTYVEFSFGVKNKQGEWVSFAKTPVDMEEEDLIELKAFIKANTIEKFGPVTSIQALQVFELSFDGINPSSRHKSGFKLISPRMISWLKSESIEAVGSLEDLINMHKETVI